MKYNLYILLLSVILLNACSGDSTDDNEVDNCVIATENTLLAQQAFANANSDDYTLLCNEFKIALQTQIDECGDENGSLQATFDNLGNCEQNLSPTALMTANLNGTQYDNMRPNGFGIFSNKAVNVVTFSYSNDEDYIKIQGNNTYSQVVPDTSTKEINLFIPENAWQVGTYALESSSNSPEDEGNTYDEVMPHIDINFFYESNSQAYTNNYIGTLSVTNFDLDNKLIEGTFEFQYTISNLDTNVDTGPYDCIDGTFSYSLNDDYFD